MKKKLLIVSHALELGGAERSLLGLLEALDYSKFIARNSRLYSISATDKADFKGRTFHIKYGKTCGENGSGKI